MDKRVECHPDLVEAVRSLYPDAEIVPKQFTSPNEWRIIVHGDDAVTWRGQYVAAPCPYWADGVHCYEAFGEFGSALRHDTGAPLRSQYEKHCACGAKVERRT